MKVEGGLCLGRKHGCQTNAENKLGMRMSVTERDGQVGPLLVGGVMRSNCDQPIS